MLRSIRGYFTAPFPAPLVQDGRTPLDCATSIDCITALLDAGAVCGSPMPGSNTPLHITARKGSEPLVRRLLAAGAPVNATDEVRDLRGSIGVEQKLRRQGM